MDNQKVTYTYEMFARDAIAIANGDDIEVDYELFSEKAKAMLNREIKSREAKAEKAKNSPKVSKTSPETLARREELAKLLTGVPQSANELTNEYTGLQVYGALKGLEGVKITKGTRKQTVYNTKGIASEKDVEVTLYAI